VHANGTAQTIDAVMTRRNPSAGLLQLNAELQPGDDEQDARGGNDHN